MGEITLGDVESALIEASNHLNGIEKVKDEERFHGLDAAIDAALTLVQDWIEVENVPGADSD